MSCNRVIDMNATYCDDCQPKMPYISGERCSFCGESKNDCSCKKHKHHYSRIVAPFYYEDGARNALLKLKKYPVYAEGIADECVAVIDECYSDIDFDLVTCVPLNKRRKRLNGFNQSEVLAKKIAEKTGTEFSPVLCTVFDAKSQHKLKSVFRAGNVRGIYDKIKSKSVAGKKVLLVDDIKTSGATLNECALILRLYDAEEVFAVAGAVARGKDL